MIRNPVPAATLAAALAAAPAARAHDFIDTRVSWTLGDDDFLHQSAELQQFSPRVGVGDRPGYQLFFENLNSRTTGRENELHLVVYRRAAGYLPRLWTEAAASLRLDMAELSSKSPQVSRVLRDDSTYIRLGRDLDRGNVELTLFPFTTGRFRLGYLYALSWGGDEIFPQRQGAAPGLRLSTSLGPVRAFAGVKTARMPTVEAPGRQITGEEIELSDSEIFYATLAGVGGDLGPQTGRLSVDAHLGYFQMGENPLPDVAGEPVDAAGGMVRVAYSSGLPIGLSADLRLYRNDPEFLENLQRKPSYPGGFDWGVALEGDAIVQTLQDPDRTGATTRQVAPAGALDVRARLDYWRFNVVAMLRSIEFMFHTRPGFVPFQALPDDLEIEPERFLAAAADRYFPGARLRPGLQVGVQWPANLTAVLTGESVGSNPPDFAVGRQTVLVRADRTQTLLPSGEEAVPIFSSKATLTWEVSGTTTLVAMAFATLDENLVQIVRNEQGLGVRTLEDQPLLLGAALVAQARF